jgi:hypothetical protein
VSLTPRIDDAELERFYEDNVAAFAHTPRYDVPVAVRAAFDLRDLRANQREAEGALDDAEAYIKDALRVASDEGYDLVWGACNEALKAIGHARKQLGERGRV